MNVDQIEINEIEEVLVLNEIPGTFIDQCQNIKINIRTNKYSDAKCQKSEILAHNESNQSKCLIKSSTRKNYEIE